MGWRDGAVSKQSSLIASGITKVKADGWSGEFERQNFGPGFSVAIAKLEVERDTVIAVNGQTTETPIFAMSFLKGSGHLAFPGGLAAPLGPRRALIGITPARTGSFHIPGPQSVLFFSVALSAILLNSLLDNEVPPQLGALVETDGRALVLNANLTARLRSDLLKWENKRLAEPLRKLHVQGLALHYLADVLRQFGVSDEAKSNQGLRFREAERVRRARRKLTADLRKPPSISAVAKAVGLTTAQMQRGFNALYSESPSKVLRRERLEHARTLLTDPEIALKEIAWRVGYGHVSNFVNAFTDHFGESPRRMSREGW